ncbi:thioesterase domain-containing protein [Streptomyces sp. NPDC051001]|uniref:thioesterase II family protein n=1 Tax=Streptomyces sp. NPDC051001 TaxID=3155795 RepID=UPI00344304C3
MAATLTPLLCLPPAGAGAGFYRPWFRGVPSSVGIAPLQLPGREERWAEPSWRTVREALGALVPRAVALAAGADGRVALFGHGFGALLAYELARALETQRGIHVLHVFASGAATPGIGLGATAKEHYERATDEDLSSRLEHLIGYRHRGLARPELREHLLRPVRGDLAVLRAYRHVPEPVLSAPLTCLRGSSDTWVTAADCARWASATTGVFRAFSLPGGHMYLKDSTAQIVDLIAATLAYEGA